MIHSKYLILVWIVGCFGIVFGAETTDRIRIYLPNEKTVESEIVELGQIAVVLGDDAVLPKINDIRLGQFSVQGQEITIHRQTILRCLAGLGVKASSVSFNGAETIRIRRNEKMITADRFIDVGRSYLSGLLSEEQIKTLKLVRSARDYPVKDGDVTLDAMMSNRRSDRMKYVTVRIMRDGVELGRQELAFSLQHPCQRMIAKHSLSAGTLITPENTEIEEFLSDTPMKEDVSRLYGMETRRTVSGGTAITALMAKRKEIPVLIKKRQRVMLKLDAGALYVSAPAEAAEEGRVGDIISVHRGSRKSGDLKVVLGKVMPDGTVRPIL